MGWGCSVSPSPNQTVFWGRTLWNSLCNLWSRRTAGKACSMPGAKAEGAQTGSHRGQCTAMCASPVPGMWEWTWPHGHAVSHHLLGDHGIPGHSHIRSSHSVPELVLGALLVQPWVSGREGKSAWFDGKVENRERKVAQKVTPLHPTLMGGCRLWQLLMLLALVIF